VRAVGGGGVVSGGGVDPRAASSPAVSDALVLATGAVLDRDIAQVVAQTKDAVELVRLPLAPAGCEPLALPPRFALSAEPEQIGRLLDEHPSAHSLLVAGALPEGFLRDLLQPLQRRHRELALIVADPTRVFLSARGPAWYRHHGVELQTLNRIELRAITVNPVAPESHRFDSVRLRALLEQAIADVPILDVCHRDYPGARLGATAA
jgi:hypothetical protein